MCLVLFGLGFFVSFFVCFLLFSSGFPQSPERCGTHGKEVLAVNVLVRQPRSTTEPLLLVSAPGRGWQRGDLGGLCWG